MTERANGASFDARGAAIVALLAFAIYAIGLGASDLSGDPLKYALDVSYPHPPLFRGAMWWAQAWFGATAFWARVPMVFLASLAGGLGWMLLRHAGASRTTAGLLMGGLLLTPAWATVVREGYLGSGLAFTWLLAIVGIVQLERRHDRLGLLALFAALIGGLWGQIQNLWLLPALMVAAWFFRTRWKEWGLAERILLVLIGLNGILWGLYVLTSPLIVGDILFFIEGRPEGGVMIPSVPFMTAMLGIIALWGYRLAAHGRVPLTPWEWTGIALCLTVIPLILLNPVAWYAPYLWACTAMTLAATVRVFPIQWQAKGAFIIALFFAWGGWHAWSVAPQSYRTQATQIQTVIGDARELIILGAHGYEWEYYLATINRRLPVDSATRANIMYAIVPHPHSLNEEERAWRAQQTRVGSAGSIEMYEITNP